VNLFVRIIKAAEKFAIITLIASMANVFVIGSWYNHLKKVFSSIESRNFLLNINVFMEIYDFFLIDFVGFELFETVKLYLKENIFHREAITMVCLITLARKVRIIDYSNENSLTIFAIASIIITVSVGYFSIKKTTLRWAKIRHI